LNGDITGGTVNVISDCDEVVVAVTGNGEIGRV
jgi:hypothetical protein